MKFFTPELYVRFNSDDDDEADQADADWEQALVNYQAHWKALERGVPKSVKALHKLCLHDCPLLAFEQFEASPGSKTAVLSVQEPSGVLSLIYSLTGKARVHAPIRGWRFGSPDDLHWLYDEIDAGADGGFVQRVLFSDGRVFEIPFSAVVLHRVPNVEPARKPA